MNETEEQKQIQLMASTILSGLLANGNVVSHDPFKGWTVADATGARLAVYAVRIAKTIIAATAEVSQK